MKRASLEMEQEELLKRIEAYGGDGAGFTRIAAAALIFASLSGRRDDLRRHLAGACECALSTVDRWGTGVAMPLPRMRQIVLGHVAEFYRQSPK